MSESAQVKFIREWGQGFQKKDANALASGLHKDFRMVTYPKSLGKPEQNKEQWVAELSKIFPLWLETTASPFCYWPTLLHPY